MAMRACQNLRMKNSKLDIIRTPNTMEQIKIKEKLNQ